MQAGFEARGRNYAAEPLDALLDVHMSGNANSRPLIRDGFRGGRNAPYVLAGWSLISKNIGG
jgi:hypothetical protein